MVSPRTSASNAASLVAVAVTDVPSQETDATKAVEPEQSASLLPGNTLFVCAVSYTHLTLPTICSV